VRNKTSGKKVIELLLALGDGDNLVIDRKAWTSYEEHGFEVENLRDGGVEHVDREEVERRFAATKQYEVVR
jgi:hypothetical protein